MIITVDDLCLEYLDNFPLFDEMKVKYPDLKITAFAIGNFKNREPLEGDKIFEEWYRKRSHWVEIAVHSYDHLYPPDGDRDDEELWITKALHSLKVFLPQEYGYRSPGWQTTNKTEGILRKLGFSYIAYEDKIKYLNINKIEYGVVNSHLYDIDSIKRIYEVLQN
jgi:peptidoglycan/xylan/chitin deacetylase (PgdA/CDA1 family)